MKQKQILNEINKIMLSKGVSTVNNINATKRATFNIFINRINSVGRSLITYYFSLISAPAAATATTVTTTYLLKNKKNTLLFFYNLKFY